MRMSRLGLKKEEDMIIDIIGSRLLTGYEIINELEMRGMNFGLGRERDEHIQQFLRGHEIHQSLRLDPSAMVKSQILVQNTYCLMPAKLRQHNLDRLIQ